MATAKSHRELRVYQLAFESATRIHEVTKAFPAEEKIQLNRPDQEIIPFSLRKYCRSLEKKKIPKELRQQVDRL